MNRTVLGIFENVDFPEFGIKSITAKIDTGAYSGAFHCTKIKEIDSRDSKILHFSPFDNPNIDIKTADYSSMLVKSSNGERQKRFTVKAKIVVAGKEYITILSLADRTTMKWPVIIGRRFLIDNNFLVDVNKKSK